MLDFLSEMMEAFGYWLVTVLPNSPFQNVIPALDGLQEGLGWLNWFFPVSACLGVMTVWLASIAIFYVYRAIVSWVGFSK